jgi:hypothetical protein
MTPSTAAGSMALGLDVPWYVSAYVSAQLSSGQPLTVSPLWRALTRKVVLPGDASGGGKSLGLGRAETLMA